MIDVTKPVRLRRAPEMRGTVTAVGRDGSVSVAFDGGSVGQFPPDALEQAAEDKAWPPPDLETKRLA